MKSLDEELEIERVKTVPYPDMMSLDLALNAVNNIPDPSQYTIDNPEWTPSEVRVLDLTSIGYGIVYVKNEADPKSNPNKISKDRPNHERVVDQRNRAVNILNAHGRHLLNGNIETIPIIRPVMFSAGSNAVSLANQSAQYGLAPPVIVVSSNISEQKLRELMMHRMDLIKVNTNKRMLTSKDMLDIAKPYAAIDYTGNFTLQQLERSYDWFDSEVKNLEPDYVFQPAGSMLQFESQIYWQEKHIRNEFEGTRDPRLNVSIESVVRINYLAAIPEKYDSKAEMLTAKFRRNAYSDEDIDALKKLGFTGKDTGKYTVKEEYIRTAYEIFKANKIESSYSGAAGLALYMQLFDEKKIDPTKKSVVVNTGVGI